MYKYSLSLNSEKNNFHIILAIIVLTGLALRVVGANWGSPLLLHPDEWAITNFAYKIASLHSWNPGFYDRPNHFSIYLHSLLYSAFSYLIFHKSLMLTFNEHINAYYEYSRIIIALFGTGMILIGYLIGKEFSVRMGLYSALVFAIFPPFIEHSHYITPDIPLTFLLMVVVLFFIKYAKTENRTYAFLSSIFIALAVAEKYPALTVMPILFLLIILIRRNSKKIIFDLILCGLIFISSLFFISPYLFINYPDVIAAFTQQSTPYHLGADGLGFIGNMMFYAQICFINLGIIGALLLLLGLFFSIKNETFIKLLPLFSGFLYWILLSYIPLHWERWALPMYVSPLLLIAYGLDKIDYLFFLTKDCNLSIRVLCGLLFIVFVLNLALTSLSITTSFTLRDTRNLTVEYAKLHGITNDNSIFDYPSFFPGGPSGTLFMKFKNLDKTKTQYFILSEASYGRYQKERERYKEQNQIYDQLFSYPLLKEFNRTNGDRLTSLFSPAPSAFEPSNLFRQAKIVKNNLLFWDQSARGPTIKIYNG